MRTQIKSEERVRQNGEVFTNPREVNAMLDLVSDVAKEIDSTFLEPACGDGNFLDEILRRKLKTVAAVADGDSSLFESCSIRAFASIYGIDIMRDNVEESKERLYDNFFAIFVNLFQMQPSELCRKCIRYVLDKNIQCGNSLTYKNADGTPLMITEWTFTEKGVKARKYNFRNLVESGCECKSKNHFIVLPACFRVFSREFS